MCSFEIFLLHCHGCLQGIQFTCISSAAALSLLLLCHCCLQESGQVEWQHYSYFLLLSSVVRGPFMPTYLQGTMHWADALLQ
jgi:hypothetical protein